MKQRIALLGSTGSIGIQTLDIVRENPGLFEITTLTAHRNWERLARQAVEFDADSVVIADERQYDALRQALDGTSIKVYAGEEALRQVVQSGQVDVVVNALVGYVGLMPTIAAVEAGKKVALANKETQVAGGCYVMPLAARHKAPIVPIDSEHSAIFQCLAGEKSPVRRLIVTCSGGAFRDRSREELDAYLARHDIPGIAGLDTRALTRHLRTRGTMNGMLTSRTDWNIQACVKLARDYRVRGVVARVSRKEMEHFPGQGPRVALMDYGAKNSILKSLRRRGCDLYVFPQDAPAEEVLAVKPDGIMLSNGPGDPEECTGPIACVRRLYESGIPIFGICLGHQITALALGARTEKMEYGHRGVNHPVKELATGRVYITSQNHGYVVRGDSVPSEGKVSFVNVNDGTVEGVSYDGGRVFTVQFHPEASPGPVDTGFLFDRFIHVMGGKRDA